MPTRSTARTPEDVEVAESTLTAAGPARPEHGSPDAAVTVRSAELLRLVTRRLFDVADAAGTLVPDLALRLPDPAGGDLDPDGRTYRIPIRRTVFWDAQ